MAKTTSAGVGLDGIDRLEAKVKMLVDLIGQMRKEQARMSDENLRLTRDLEETREKLAQAEGVAAECGTLKEEREAIRTRVSEMLEQLETLSL